MSQKKVKNTSLSKEDVPSVILPVYKEKGMSSFDVIRELKKSLPRKTKIGHFGTLDPFADGLLLVGLGRSLKLADMIHELCPKGYLARGLVGKKTNTGDLEGEVILEKKPCLKKEELIQAIQNFNQREYLQVPPAFSATKFQGKKLYEYARQGEFIKKDPVLRKIFSAELVSYDINSHKLALRTLVSSGTYIRTLFEDILEKIEEVGHLVELTRESIGKIRLDKCLKVADWSEKLQRGDFSEALEPTSFFDFPIFQIQEEDRLKKLSHGNPVRAQESEMTELKNNSGSYCWLFQNEKCLSLSQLVSNEFRVAINFQS